MYHTNRQISKVTNWQEKIAPLVEDTDSVCCFYILIIKPSQY